ncbi:MAG TPA: dihydropteroate synthase [Sediminibacterium sp.]|nr:dihydropteroate synthase [Sediminibacterium sp.]
MFTLNSKGSLWTIRQPVVMGIINATPDSFFSKSRATGLEAAVATAARMIREGAALLDIGGQSTRPGAVLVGEAEEIDRVVPVINAIHQAFPGILLSVDTYYPAVAQAAVAAGASVVNDISGGRYNTGMLPAVAALKVPYILMHSTGTATTMHETSISGNITLEVVRYFKERLEACTAAGIQDLILDPGLGFGKTMEQNFQLLSELNSLQLFRLPVLLGISRKTMIHKTLQITPEESLNGTTVLNTIGLLNKVNILRVHDVKEAVQAVQLVNALYP